jgi:outer membrane receptor protein involved in Fe transport
VGERYITNDLFNTLRIIANPELQPEKGWNLEFGLTQGFQILNFKAGFDAAFFWQEYKQFVEYRFVSAGTEPDLFAGDSLFVGLYPSNVENARVAGFEIGLTGSGKIGAFEIVPSIGYTYTYPVNIDSFGTNVGEYLKMMFADLGRRVPEERKGQILQFRSRHLFVGDLAVTWKRISVGASVYYGSYPEVIPTTFGIAVGFLSGDFESFDRYEQEHLKGDWVFDVRASYGINDKLKVGFMVKNVANKYYSTRPSMPEPNRNYTLQLQVKF